MPDAHAEAEIPIAFGQVQHRGDAQIELLDEAEDVPGKQAKIETDRAVHARRYPRETARLEVAAGAQSQQVGNGFAFRPDSKRQRRVATRDLAPLLQERLEAH